MLRRLLTFALLLTTLQTHTILAQKSPHALPPLPQAASAGVPAPLTGSTAIAATAGHGPIYIANATGLYRSKAPPFSSWTRQANEGAIVALSVGQTGNDLLYVTQDGRITRSLDGGTSGTTTASGLHATTLARAASKPAVVYACGTDGQNGYIYRSVDDGVSWSTVLTAPAYGPGSTSIDDLAVDPGDPNHVYAAESVYHGGAVLESHDGGRSWRTLPVPAGTALEAPTALVLQAGSPGILWAAWSVMGYGQLESSADGGSTWQVAALPPASAGRISSMSPDSASGRLYVDLQASGAGHAQTVLLTQDGGKHFLPVLPAGVPVGMEVLVTSGCCRSFPAGYGPVRGYMLTGDASTPVSVRPLLRTGVAGAPISLTLAGPPPTPAVITIIAGSADGNLYAIDGETGSYEWAFHTGAALTSPQVLHGRVLVAGSTNGAVYAVNAQTGVQLWRFDAGAAVSAPRVSGSLVLVSAHNQHMYALAAATGTLVWQAHTPGDVSQFAIAGNTVYVAASAVATGAASANAGGHSSITALDLHSGTQRWRVTLASFLTASLQAASGTVFAGSTDGRVWALRADTGAVRWRYVVDSTHQVPGPAQLATPSQGLLVLTGVDDQITTLDTATGKVRWRYAVQGKVPAAAAIAGDARIVAGSWDGVLYALDARSGALTWRIRFPSAIYTTPFVLKNTAYVSGVDGNLYPVDLRDGALGSWHYHAGATYTVPAAESPADVPGNAAIKGRYFAVTGHDLSGAFLAFWDGYGGMPIFGYPITEPYSQNGQTIQFTERFGLVLKNGVVSTLPLGSTYTTGRAFAKSAPPTGATGKYFASTGQSLSGRFLAYWQAHHGDVLLGAPISGVVYEGNGDGSGRRYQLQWFERGRLEYHPENGHTPYEMQIGLLGTQTLQAWGWLS